MSNPYALQKYTAEQYDYYLVVFGLKLLYLFATSIHMVLDLSMKNPDNAYSSVIGIFQNQFENNSKLTITGDVSKEISYMLVLAANIQIAESDIDYGIYNVGFGKAISVLKVAKQISDNYEFSRKVREAEITLADNSKLKIKRIGFPLWRFLTT